MFSSPRNREEYLSSSVLDWIAVVFDGVGRGGDAATVHATGKIREICKNGTANIGLCSFAIGPTFHRHIWSHRVIHWEWQIHEWSVFAVLILQFFREN